MSKNHLDTSVDWSGWTSSTKCASSPELVSARNYLPELVSTPKLKINEFFFLVDAGSDVMRHVCRLKCQSPTLLHVYCCMARTKLNHSKNIQEAQEPSWVMIRSRKKLSWIRKKFGKFATANAKGWQEHGYGCNAKPVPTQPVAPQEVAASSHQVIHTTNAFFHEGAPPARLPAVVGLQSTQK